MNFEATYAGSSGIVNGVRDSTVALAASTLREVTFLEGGIRLPLLLREGLARLKATGADVVLIDPQYAPKVIAKRNADGMVSLIAATATAEHVSHFRRFDLMRHWHETEHLPFKAFVSPDGLHMNDWSYGCLAKALGLAIAEAAERPTATAIGPTPG